MPATAAVTAAPSTSSRRGERRGRSWRLAAAELIRARESSQLSRLSGGRGVQSAVPGIRYGAGAQVIESIHVIGSGRVGSAVAARLRERGVAVGDDEAELVLLCVPDAAIAEVAAGSRPGPWVAHVSGATPLAALAPHERRFRVHPLQTFTRGAEPEQFDGAWAAVTAESDEALAARAGSPRHSGCSRSSSPTATGRSTTRAPSSPRTTSSRCSARGAAVRAAGVPAEALVPLMLRTIENGFELTGPIARGDWATVEAHRAAIRGGAARARAPLRDARRGDGGARMGTSARSPSCAARAGAGRSGSCRRWARSTTATVALFAAARARATRSSCRCSSTRPSSTTPADLAAYPRDEARDLALAEEAASTSSSRPPPTRCTRRGSPTWVEAERGAGGSRATRGRATSAASRPSA